MFDLSGIITKGSKRAKICIIARARGFFNDCNCLNCNTQANASPVSLLTKPAN